MDLETISDHPSKFFCSGKRIDFSKIILTTARKIIPRDRQRVFKSFWNEKLASLKDIYSGSRSTAEESKDPEDIRKWRRNAAILKIEIFAAKGKSFNYFINGIDYRKDANRVYKNIYQIFF